MPPADLLHEVCKALQEAGLDPFLILARSSEITQEFKYDPNQPDLCDRFKPKFVSATMVPVKNKNISEILSPQPRCSEVLKDLHIATTYKTRPTFPCCLHLSVYITGATPLD